MSSAEDIAKSLMAAFGPNDEESTVTQFLDTGLPELNAVLSSKWDGGLPVGRIVEIAGPPSSGKTAIATEAMAAAQKMGGIAGFHDHERSFSLRLAPRLGLDPTPGKFVYRKPKTFEESISLAVKYWRFIREKKLIAEDAPIAWVFDSLAAMVPHCLFYDDKGNEIAGEKRNMKDNMALALATSAHFPALALQVEEFNVCAMFLNQVRTKPGVMYGDPRYTVGGDAPKFYASVRLMLGAAQIKKGTDVLGSEVTAVAIKNKVARPFTSAKWRFVFQEDGTGKFDKIRSTIDFLTREKILEMSGAYVNWNGSKIYPSALAEKIENEGLWNDLIALLPAKYEPILVKEEDVETGEDSLDE